ncbi:hypothetical protein N7G274_008893 [Stereocaulon virgatum]|uniref:C2H2-type domain-containing protein n=1 Tax=Stereocaulon virgatum TaxID=373712 RepID=A0ABR3ZYE0_9LECA
MEGTSWVPDRNVSRFHEEASSSCLTSPIISNTPQRRSFRPRQTPEVVLHNFQIPVREEEGIITLRIPYPPTAIETLRKIDKDKVFDSLALVRSYSNEELGAFLALRSWPNDSIREWFQSGHGSANANVINTRQASDLMAAQPQSPYRSDPQPSTQQGSSHLSSTGSFSLQSSCSNCIIPDTRRGRRSRGHQAPGIPQEDFPSDKISTSTIISDHVHWCTICEQPRQYETCDGYKRHEKEHETRFICMPFGAVEYKNGSSHCTLCGGLNPTPRHLQSHQLGSCTQNTRSFPRKSLLVNHLKAHGAKAGEALAERWRRPTEKRAFACGFCVQLFSTMVDRLNHIDAHFKNRQHIHDWDANKVIEGLLRQPGLNEYWRQIVSSNAHIASSGFTWD